MKPKLFLKFINTVLRLPFQVWEMCISHLPGPIGFFLRYRYWKKRVKFLGHNVKIDIGVYFQNPQLISIDDNCWIDRYVTILAGKDNSKRPRRLIQNPLNTQRRGHVTLGKNIHIGPHSIISGIGGVSIFDNCGLSSGVKIYSFSHHYRSDEFPDNTHFHFGPLFDHERQYMIEGSIVLENNVGIALNSIILPGVHIGMNSFVSINSVVACSFGENSFIAGNPAKIIKNRFETDNFEYSIKTSSKK